MISGNADQKNLTSAIFTAAMITGGMVVVGAAVLLQVSQTNQSWLVMLASIFVLTSVRAKRLLGEKFSASLGDFIALCSAALFGPGAACIVTAANRAAISGRLEGGYRKWLYNVAACAVSMNAAIYLTLSILPQFGSHTIEMSPAEMVAAMALSMASYFIISTFVLTAYEAFRRKESLFALMEASFLWTSISLLLSAPSALGTYLMRQWNYDDSRANRKSRVGEMLIARGLITQGDLKFALEAQRKSAHHAKRLGEILVDMGLVEERHVLEALADRFGPSLSAI